MFWPGVTTVSVMGCDLRAPSPYLAPPPSAHPRHAPVLALIHIQGWRVSSKTPDSATNTEILLGVKFQFQIIQIKFSDFLNLLCVVRFS